MTNINPQNLPYRAPPMTDRITGPGMQKDCKLYEITKIITINRDRWKKLKQSKNFMTNISKLLRWFALHLAGKMGWYII